MTKAPRGQLQKAELLAAPVACRVCGLRWRRRRGEKESRRVAEVDVLHKRCFHEAVATGLFPCRFFVFFDLRSIAIFLRNYFLFAQQLFRESPSRALGGRVSGGFLPFLRNAFFFGVGSASAELRPGRDLPNCMFNFIIFCFPLPLPFEGLVALIFSLPSGLLLFMLAEYVEWKSRNFLEEDGKESLAYSTPVEQQLAGQLFELSDQPQNGTKRVPG
ncbi:unnamed protein product [Sphagnum jensenii]|uniref:Uncharacterized protein n=1 Tax=Sphagnum jensenii TaxID=128206 RepID=A0ABP1AFR5_9BRYO